MALTETGNNDVRRVIAWGLRRLRVMHGNTLEEQAKQLKISPEQMLKLETGEDAVSVEQLYRLLVDWHGMTFDEFFAHLPELYYPVEKRATDDPG